MGADHTQVQDVVMAQLTDVSAPDPVSVPLPPLPETPTPVVRAAHATVEQTGADPPPA